MGEFISPGKSIKDKKLKNARMGDMIDYDSHVAIVVGVDGKGVWTIGGNEMDHVSVSWIPYSSLKDGFHKLCHTVKKSDLAHTFIMGKGVFTSVALPPFLPKYSCSEINLKIVEFNKAATE